MRSGTKAMPALAGAGFALLATFLADAAAAQPGGRPVRIGLAGGEFDACSPYAEVSGLNRRGDNFLSVRAAPGAAGRELDRLGPGRRVWICEEGSVPGWTGIVYASRRDVDCHVGGPVPRPRPYRGPCRAGWVAARYLTPIAG